MLQDVVKKLVKMGQRRAAVKYLRSHYPVSDRRACRTVQLSRSVWHYLSTRAGDGPLRRRIRDIAETRTRYGYKRIYIMLRREGVVINHRRVYRLYSEEGLTLRSKRPHRHVNVAHRQTPRKLPCVIGHTLSIDFVAERFEDGRRFRMLTIVDVFTRECLASEVDRKPTGDDVTRVLDRLCRSGCSLERIFCDNGSELAGRLLDQWAYEHGVTLEFSRPGKPTDNAHIESFNGSLRDECLKIHWFSTLTDARAKIEAWRQHYNVSRPHKSLGYLTPLEFKANQNI